MVKKPARKTSRNRGRLPKINHVQTTRSHHRRHPHPPRCLQSRRPRPQNTAHPLVSPLRGRHIQHPSHQPTANHRLHRAPTRARGMKNQYFLTRRLQDLLRHIHTRRRIAKHTGHYQRPLRLLPDLRLHHPAHRPSRPRKQQTRKPVQPGHIHNTREHDNVRGPDIRSRVAAR